MVHTEGGLGVMRSIQHARDEKYNGLPVIMEIDDNILSCPTYNPANVSYGPNDSVRQITIKQLKEADAVITTTPYLKEVYSEFNDNIYVLPNSIDFDIWGKVQHKRNKGKITIGWVGAANHKADLMIIEPTIDYLTKKYPQVEFCFGHGIHPDFRGRKGVRWEHEFIRIDKYPKAIAQMGFDIGMAPLVDNAFNRGKSNLRWLEYSALGIPTVASNVGHFAETIKHGKDGLLCDTTQDFIDALESLIVNTSLRKELGKAAKERVFNDFNIDNTVKDYKRTFEEVIAIHKITANQKVAI
jgi:glycosyltransferase involved in cell wall biosynthesis